MGEQYAQRTTSLSPPFVESHKNDTVYIGASGMRAADDRPYGIPLILGYRGRVTAGVAPTVTERRYGVPFCYPTTLTAKKRGHQRWLCKAK